MHLPLVHQEYVDIQYVTLDSLIVMETQPMGVKLQGQSVTAQVAEMFVLYQMVNLLVFLGLVPSFRAKSLITIVMAYILQDANLI